MAGEDLNPDSKKKDEGEPRTVPLEALEAERRKRQDADTRAAELQGQVRGLTAAKVEPQADAPKTLSAAELRLAVDEGKISEGQADDIKTRQMRVQVTKEVTENVTSSLAAEAVAGRVSVEIGRYNTAIPDLTNRDSAAFRKVKSEFDFLVSLGQSADDPRTELQAARAAFGDINQLEKIGKPGERETHQEVGGNAEPGPKDSKDGWPKDMPADTKRYYDDQINQGVLPDRKSAVAEWSYKPQHAPRHAKVA